MYLWMAVSNDEYELPYIVEPSARLLGDKMHVNTQTIVSSARSRNLRRSIIDKSIKIVKVKIEREV